MTTPLATARVNTLFKVDAIEPRMAAKRVTTALGTTTQAEMDNLGHFSDDSFVDETWLCLPDGPTGSGSFEAQRVSAFDQDDGSGNTLVTVYEAFSGVIQNAVAAYVTPIEPETLRVALNTAAGRISGDVGIGRQFRHITGSRVFNGFFDVWSGGLPVWWARSNSGLTVTQDPNAWFGDWCAKLTADGTARYLYTQPPMPSQLNDLVGSAVTLHAMIYATGASEIGLAIADGGGADATVYHAGDSQWTEVQTAATTIVAGDPANPLEFRVHVAIGATGYVGPVWTEGGPGMEYMHVPRDYFWDTPASLHRAGAEWPSHRWANLDVIDFTPERRYPAASLAGSHVLGSLIRYSSRQTQTPRLLVASGEGRVNYAASAETDAYELEPPRDELLYVEAIIELQRALGSRAGSGTSTFHRQMARDWAADRDELLKKSGFKPSTEPHVMRPTLSGPGHVGIASERYSL